MGQLPQLRPEPHGKVFAVAELVRIPEAGLSLGRPALSLLAEGSPKVPGSHLAPGGGLGLLGAVVPVVTLSRRVAQ